MGLETRRKDETFSKPLFMLLNTTVLLRSVINVFIPGCNLLADAMSDKSGPYQNSHTAPKNIYNQL